MAQTQKAALLLSKHGKIEVGTRPIPSPEGKQALVKVTAAASKYIVSYDLYCCYI
jgi:NADPH:quinone reductase-like Zn-dependent oxidoreductase